MPAREVHGLVDAFVRVNLTRGGSRLARACATPRRRPGFQILLSRTRWLFHRPPTCHSRHRPSTEAAAPKATSVINVSESLSDALGAAGGGAGGDGGDDGSGDGGGGALGGAAGGVSMFDVKSMGTRGRRFESAAPMASLPITWVWSPQPVRRNKAAGHPSRSAPLACDRASRSK